MFSLLLTKAMLDFAKCAEAKLNTKSDGPLFIFEDKLFTLAGFVAFAYG